MSVIVMKLENLSEYFSSEVAFQNAPKLILSSESCLLPWKQKKTVTTRLQTTIPRY